MGKRAYWQRIGLTSKGGIYTVTYCGRAWSMKHALELVKILYYVYEGEK